MREIGGEREAKRPKKTKVVMVRGGKARDTLKMT